MNRDEVNERYGEWLRGNSDEIMSLALGGNRDGPSSSWKR